MAELQEAAPPAQKTELKKDGEEERLQKEIEALQLQLAATQKQNKMDKLGSRGVKTSAPSRMLTQSSSHSYPSSLWRKDFKIAGQIGEPGQKDLLTFSSLACQIEPGLSK